MSYVLGMKLRSRQRAIITALGELETSQERGFFPIQDVLDEVWRQQERYWQSMDPRRF